MWMSSTCSSTPFMYNVMESRESMVDISSGFLYPLLLRLPLLFVLVDCDVLLYTVSEKDCTLFLFFFSRCPVCGEWCKLH